jgi:hypothetical protein
LTDQSNGAHQSGWQEMPPAEPGMHSGLMSPIGHCVDISVSAFTPLLEVKRT